VEDLAGNETRFVWLARPGAAPGPPGIETALIGAWKTSIVFWGVGAEAPGWLVSCLSELSNRGVNLTRIESRPRKQGLGRYMFFADLEGRDTEPYVTEALAALATHVEVLRVLGSFPAFAPG
jgi:prephenate dehydratase